MKKKRKKSRIWRKLFLILLLILTLASIGRWSLQQIRPEYPELVKSVDVIVIGSGLAGSVAALSAAEAGAEVFLIDLSTENGSGFPNFSPAFWAAGTPYQEEWQLEYSPEEMSLEIYARGDQGGNLEQIEAFSAASAAVMSWLEDRTGILFSRLADMENRPWLHLPARGEAALFVLPELEKHLTLQLSGYSRQLFPEELQITGDRITGVLVRDEEGRALSFLCRAVVLADGGIGGNTVLLRTYTGLEDILPRPEGGHGGRGITLALAVSATAEDLERVALLPVLLPEGRRFDFADYAEAVYFDIEGNEIFADADAVSVIKNAGGKVYVVLGHGQGSAPGTFTSFIDVGEIAEALGVSYYGLDETLAALEAPYSVGTVELIALTPGGLATDSDLRVLGPDGPIGGLFAAGETAAGLHGERVIADLFFTADTVSARLAGQFAARYANR